MTSLLSVILRQEECKELLNDTTTLGSRKCAIKASVRECIRLQIRKIATSNTFNDYFYQIYVNVCGYNFHFSLGIVVNQVLSVCAWMCSWAPR